MAPSLQDAALPPDACRDDGRLAAFIRDAISPNAWPIHSPALRRRLEREGLSLVDRVSCQPSIDRLVAVAEHVYRRAVRVERALSIANSFHAALHNLEVLLRLLILEWPNGSPRPRSFEQATQHAYHDAPEILGVVRDTLGHLSDAGVPRWVLARDVLAAAGHDYGHTGGTDRIDRDGRPAPLTHEEASERHVAKVGLTEGFPLPVILESLGGIRATTFYSRPGRDRVQAVTEFERKLTLADVMGCVLPPDLWLTHVGFPVLKEKLPIWRRRLEEIPHDIANIQAAQATLAHDQPERAAANEKLKELYAEDARIIKDLAEWFRSERGFFLFIEAHRLKPVAGGPELWGDVLRERIKLVERILADHDRLVPLAARGFPFLEWLANELSHVPSLEAWLAADGVDPALRGILRTFLPGGAPAERGHA